MRCVRGCMRLGEVRRDAPNTPTQDSPKGVSPVAPHGDAPRAPVAASASEGPGSHAPSASADHAAASHATTAPTDTARPHDHSSVSITLPDGQHHTTTTRAIVLLYHHTLAHFHNHAARTQHRMIISRTGGVWGVTGATVAHKRPRCALVTGAGQRPVEFLKGR